MNEKMKELNEFKESIIKFKSDWEVLSTISSNYVKMSDMINDFKIKLEFFLIKQTHGCEILLFINKKYKKNCFSKISYYFLIINLSFCCCCYNSSNIVNILLREEFNSAYFSAITAITMLEEI